LSDFGRELARLMTVRSIGVRELSRRVHYNAGHISNLRNGKAHPSPDLARDLDDALDAGGTLTALAPPAGHRRRAAPGKHSRVADALQIALSGGTAGPESAADGLADLIPHYSHAVSAAASAQVYDELLSVRSFRRRPAGPERPAQPRSVGHGRVAVRAARDLGDRSRRPRGRSGVVL
jgi:helix-turn-helix protein